MTEAEIAIVEEVRAASDAFVSLCRTLEVELGTLSLAVAAVERAASAVERAAAQWERAIL
jgi:hypothetical protein